MIDITINILYNMFNNLSINRKEALCFEKYIRKGGGKLIMAKRRGNGEGTIYKRQDGTWAGQVSIGYDPVTGKLKRKSFYGKTRKEVADKMAQVLQEVRNGTFVEPAQTTFGEWLDKWLTSYKKGQLKPTTYQGYEILINVHIKPALGKSRWQNCSPTCCRRFTMRSWRLGERTARAACQPGWYGTYMQLSGKPCSKL